MGSGFVPSMNNQCVKNNYYYIVKLIELSDSTPVCCVNGMPWKAACMNMVKMLHVLKLHRICVGK